MIGAVRRASALGSKARVVSTDERRAQACRGDEALAGAEARSRTWGVAERSNGL